MVQTRDRANIKPRISSLSLGQRSNSEIETRYKRKGALTEFHCWPIFDRNKKKQELLCQ